MSIEITCHCGQRFAAAPRLAGTTVTCLRCGAPIAVPASEPPPPHTVRCHYCHEHIPQREFAQHVQSHEQLRPDGQQTDYATLPPAERAATEEFENAPRWYRHERCGQITGMPEEIIQTYLTNPWFYLADRTFCTGCGKHVRQRECTWTETGEDLQTYTDRLRAAKPQFRPGIFMRLFAKVVSLFQG